MDDVDIRAWLSLCRAARRLPAKKQQDWIFMVGTSGTLAERVTLGQAALASLGRVWSFTPGKEADDAERP